MAVQVEIWERYLVNRLWKQNAFLKNSTMSDNGEVIQGKMVHIPQPGTLPVVVKNRRSFPAGAVQRMDNDVTYVLDVYTTDPTHIFEADKREVSYDKMDSVFGDHVNSIAETIAEDLLIKWFTHVPSSNMVMATGAAAAARLPGQTGNRRIVTVNDIKNLAFRFNAANVPMNDRFLLLDANMYDHFTSDMSVNQTRDFSVYFDAKTGVCGQLFGINILQRSTVLVASATLAPNALGQAVQAGDHGVGLAWQKSSLAQAVGEVKMFQDTDNPLYYGDIYSGLIRMGGRMRRADGAGVFALVEGA